MARNLPEWMSMISKAYTSASDESADMKLAAESLEAIKTSIHVDNIFEILSTLDRQIARVNGTELQSVILKLREDISPSILRWFLNELHEDFEIDKKQGWINWLESFSRGLPTRPAICSSLLEEKYPFPARADRTVKKIKEYSRIFFELYYAAAYDLFSLLAREVLLSNFQRSNMLVHVGLTQLWSFLNPTQAKQIFEEAQELSENNPRVHSAKGEYYLSNGEYEAAMKCFKKSIACDRTTAWAYVGIAECYEGQNDLLAAEEYYRTAIRTAPDYHWSYIKFCNFYGRPEFFSEHEEDILTLLKLMYTVYPDNKYGAFLEAARIYRKNGKYGPAHEWVDKAIELKRVPFEAYIEKGYLYFINGEYDKSRNMFLLAVEKAPNTFDGYWWLAWFHESLGNWEEALEWYGKCLERREQWKARILNKISTMNWRLKRYSLAEKQIIKALELERDDPAINNAVSKMAYQYSTTLESTEKAASLYKKILDLRGHSYKAEYHHNMAFLLTFSKNWDEARKEAEQAYKTDRDKDLYEKHLADIANQEGTSYVAEERIDEAEKKFGEALLLYDSILTRDHDNVDSWIGKGHVLYNLEKYDEAINSYNEALKKGVISPFIWKNKGDCYSIIDKMEQAIECYDKAIEIDAEFTEALTNKGEVLFSLHRYEHALKTYDRILEIDSRNAIAWYNKASILSILGRHEQALEALDRVLEINPRDIDAIINRGLELHDLGRNDKALATFDKALKIDPNDYFALNNKAWVLAKINKPEEALAVINKALDIAPNFDSALDTKGFILYELKQYKEALRFIEAALAVNSDIALRWKHKGLILDQLGKNKLAQNSYMMAQQIDNSR